MNTHDVAFKAANGMLSFDAEGEWRLNQKEVERFAHLVRAQTLEEAAGVCENTLAHHYMKQVILTHDQALLLAACADCAGAIRALKEQT